jgi:4-amino-4-deoxy-L-arabinose transferase-like glycosyltransferase
MVSRAGAGGSGQRAWKILALVLLAGVVAFQRLGQAPVYIDDEAREGVYARAMLATNDFVLPMVPYHLENGLPLPDKPPLFHWIAIAGVHVRELLQTGRWLTPAESAANFDDASLRFPSALAACVMVLGVATLGASLVGKRGALLASLVLITSLQFVHQSRFGRVDMVFATGLCMAMLAAGRAMIETNRRWLWIAGGFLGLATLGKGPMSFVLFGARPVWSSRAHSGGVA